MQYIQLEFLNTDGSKGRYGVGPDDLIPFDTILQETPDSFVSDLSGVITINVAGTYFINWFVAQQTGLATDGSNFAIVKNPGVPGEENLVLGSGHLKVSPTSGFAIITVTDGQRVALRNVSSHKATLSEFTKVKAGIAIFSLTEEYIPPVLGFNHSQIDFNEITDREFKTGDYLQFGSLIKKDASGIVEFNSTTKTFIISKAGTYLINFEIPVEGTDEHDEVFLELWVNTVLHSKAYAPLPIGVASGSAIIVIDADNANEVYLTIGANDDDVEDTLRISPSANISIAQLSINV